MKYGYILILNEIDVADAAELSGLNDVLEGRNLVVIQNNGEVIKPHPCFRLVVTANTCGRGSKGTYHGTQLLNAAFLDRFRFIGCDYMSHKEELELLRKVVNMDDKVLSDMVKVASEIRKSHLDPKPNHVYMSVPMSTRALVRWAKLASEYSSYESSPVAVALVHAFSGRLSEEERCYVTRLASDIMAEEAEINTSSD